MGLKCGNCRLLVKHVTWKISILLLSAELVISFESFSKFCNSLTDYVFMIVKRQTATQKQKNLKNQPMLHKTLCSLGNETFLKIQSTRSEV